MKHTSTLLRLFSFLFLFSAGNAAAIMGDVLPDSELPHGVCALYAKNLSPSPERRISQNTFFCSATLVSPGTAISAGHCLPEYLLQTVREDHPQALMDGLVLVCRDEEGNPLEAEVESMAAHPDFEFTGLEDFRESGSELMDISVVRLKTSLQAPVIPVLQDSSALEILEDSDEPNCKILGYGLNNDEGNGVLQGARVSFYKDSESSLITYGEGYAGPGDSGGALLCQINGIETLVGVVAGEGLSFDETSVTSILPYLKWLRSFN